MAALSVYGGKLTDCINVGNEVCETLESMGISLPFRDYQWYGEPPKVTYHEYMHQAQLLKLDEMTAPHASEPLSQRLWRRYGAELSACSKTSDGSKNADILIETSEYIRCEIYRTERHEMVITLEDFLRRRSKISQVVEHSSSNRQVCGEACQILFGGRAEACWFEYFGQPWGMTENSQAPLTASSDLHDRVAEEGKPVAHGFASLWAACQSEMHLA